MDIEPAFDPHEIEIFNLRFGRWDDSGYMIRQDELGLIVDLLNSISSGIGGGTLVVPDTYRSHAIALQSIEWTISDNPPTSRSGVKHFLNHSVITFLIYYFL